jgi:hypothetical protein
MPRLFVVTLFALNIVILAGLMLQKSANRDRSSENPESSSQEALPGITLLSESPAEEPGMGRAPLELEPQFEVTRELDTASLTERECFSLGHFDSLDDLQQLRSQLEPYTVFVSTRETYSLVDKGHWVYIPAFPTREEAKRVVAELADAGLEDFYIIPRGKNAGIISLGVYSNPGGAWFRQKEAQNLGTGHQILIGMYSEPESKYWLDYQLMDEVANPIEDWLPDNQDLSQLVLSCNDLAMENGPMENQ